MKKTWIKVKRGLLEPAHREVRTVGELVVVVLEELAQGDRVEGDGVLRLVAVVEARVAPPVAEPVHDRRHLRHERADGCGPTGRVLYRRAVLGDRRDAIKCKGKKRAGERRSSWPP